MTGLCQLKDLVELDISNNMFSGKLPECLSNLTNLRVLELSNNMFSGHFPSFTSNLTSLAYLSLYGNYMNGSFSLNTLANHSNLQNDLSGSIPFELSRNSHLQLLDLRENKLSGKIPNSMDKLSELRVLLLGGNNLEGGHYNDYFLGPVFGISTYDQYLSYVDSNLTQSRLLLMPPFKGPVERELYLEVEFRTKHNDYFYKGDILEEMTGLDLSCNNLTGTIPPQLGDLQQIRSLNLSHNYLSGPIPTTFSNLIQIESLDLSFNNLIGKIPYELTQMKFLSTFNLSYNNLSGTPPSTGQFQDFDEDNYRGNPGLCGPLLNRKCEGIASSPSSQSNGTGEKETKVDMTSFYWSFI
ncbi:receptor-like protein kinase, partial [Trifolium pratense]